MAAQPLDQMLAHDPGRTQDRDRYPPVEDLRAGAHEESSGPTSVPRPPGAATLNSTLYRSA